MVLPKPPSPRLPKKPHGRFGKTSLPLLSLLLGLPAKAAIFPPGGQVGTTVEATVSGTFEKWPPKFSDLGHGLTIEPLEKKGKLKISIPKDAKTGPRLLRVLTEKEVSAPHFFIISDQAESLEKEPNNRLDEAQEIEQIPALLNGKLNKKGDTDFFRIHLEKGQKLSAKLEAYSLKSPIDAFIHIFDPKGYEAAVASDTHNLDPHLVYEAQETGNHTLQIMAVTAKASTAITYYGTEESVYRLRLSEPSSLAPPDAHFTEAKAPEILPIPSSISGTFSEPGETDTYQVKVPKREQLMIRVESYSLKYPADPVLLVYTTPNKLLRETDDDRTRKSKDPEYLLRSAIDDPYYIKLQERFGQSGPDFHYRLSVEKPTPTFRPTLAKDTFKAEPGKDVEIKITLNRKNGHKAPLHAALTGLPDGFYIKGQTIASDAKDATLKITAQPDAPEGHHPFILYVLEDPAETPTTHQAAFSLHTSETRGDYLVNETPWLWITVPKKEPKEEKKEKEEKAGD